MNMMSKPELFCPQLPKFEVSSDIEVDGSLVSFDLKHGCIVIQCSMTADVIAKSREVAYIPNRYGSNYQYEEECEQEYEQLVVDQETFVLVVDNDNTDIPNGLRITLTESQVTELNEQLEYLAEEQADQVLAAQENRDECSS